MPLDLHRMFQDLMKAKAHLLSGLHISEGMRESRKVDGGEPLAWLQLLEPDPERRVAVWANILGQKIPGREQIRPIMMKADEEAYMTIAEELRAEGRQQGIEMGRQEGEVAGVLKAKMEGARNMLRKGYEISLIAEVTGLSHARVEALIAK